VEARFARAANSATAARERADSRATACHPRLSIARLRTRRRSHREMTGDGAMRTREQGVEEGGERERGRERRRRDETGENG